MHSKLEVKLHRQGEQGFIVANVNDEGETFKFTFGRNQPINQVWMMIPKLVMDAKFERMIREKVAV